MARGSVDLYIGFATGADCCTGLSARVTGLVSCRCADEEVPVLLAVPYGERAFLRGLLLFLLGFPVHGGGRRSGARRQWLAPNCSPKCLMMDAPRLVD